MKFLATSLAFTTVAYAATYSVDPCELGVDDVTQSAGYIDVPNGSIFYWLFEARNDPKNAPLVFWFNGGPGCSSLSGLLTENGPSLIKGNLTLEKNMFSWNEYANVIYLDQPVAVGYSVATHQVNTTVQAADDISSFYRSFFKLYPEYLENDVHLAGESYAGRYIPVFAEAIMKMQDLPKRLKSVMIGNALVDDLSYYGSNYDFFCKIDGGFPQIVNQTVCNIMRDSTPQCLADLDECIRSNNFDSGCTSFLLSDACYNTTLGLDMVEKMGLNTYNLDAKCEASSAGLCYADDDYVTEYFNQDCVKQVLGVNTSIDYQVCNDHLNLAFSQAGDEEKQTQQNVTNILSHGVQVLIYNGDKDPLINWVGARNWTRSFEWPGHEEFKTAIDYPKDFIVEGKKSGEVSNYGNMTFLRIFDSGHMVPKDQPAAAAKMLDYWVSSNIELQEFDC